MLACGIGFALSLGFSGHVVAAHLFGSQEGVLVAAEAFGRKGPGYGYQSAFQEPLHTGVELQVLEERAGWLRVAVGRGDECWLPKETIEIL